MRANRSLLETLLELQTLDRVPRMGYLLRGVDGAESVAEHTFHVVFLVWALAQEIDEVDSGRAVELALVHDLGEVRTGDLPRVATRYYSGEAKREAERAVIAEVLGPSLAARGLALLNEYQAGTEAEASPEARLVKACDRLQLMLKVAAYERWGETGLAEFWENSANFPDYGFVRVRELFDDLKAWRAERLASRG